MSLLSGHCIDGHCQPGPTSTGCTYKPCDHHCHHTTTEGDTDAT